jgi:hypothetical protein
MFRRDPVRSVGRLKIAVDDQILVRIGHGAADFAKQVEPPVGVELVCVAEHADRLAFHVLHHEVGQPVIGRSAVNQPGNVRVIELREDLPLVSEATQNVVRIEPSAD